MTEQKEQEIVDRIEKSVCKEDTQKVLQEPRNKWFRDANGSGTDSLMKKDMIKMENTKIGAIIVIQQQSYLQQIILKKSLIPRFEK